MKKRIHDQENDQERDTIKATGNKEDNLNQEDNGATGDSYAKAEEETSVEAAADKVVSEVRIIEEKLAETQDKYIRLSAEFDNYRKRTLREKMEITKYAEENLLFKIIPLMDDFERALQHIETSDAEALKNGINLIYSKFSEFLKQNGIREIEAQGNPFDVDLHEAIAKVHVDEESSKGKVVDVVLKGYYLHDKVLRFSKVVVGE